MTRIVTVLLALALLTAAVWGQPPAGSPPGDEDLLGPSPWHDTVHYFGIASGVLALVALAAGGVLYFGHSLPRRPYGSPARRLVRGLHMAAGAAAVACGLVHFLGRLASLGDYRLAASPPYLAMYCFVLVLASGLLRNWTPKALRKHWRLFGWLHRLAVLAAFCFLTRHSLHEYQDFRGR